MLEYLDILKTTDGYYALCAERTSDQFLFDPDGKRFYFQDVSLQMITNGVITATRVFANIPVAQGAIRYLPEDASLQIFLNFKTTSGSYGMAGSLYTFAADTLATRICDTLFLEENMGWFPYFDEGHLEHFSYAGYFHMRDLDKQDHLLPQEFAQRSQTHRAEHSAGILTPEATTDIITSRLLLPKS